MPIWHNSRIHSTAKTISPLAPSSLIVWNYLYLFLFFKQFQNGTIVAVIAVKLNKVCLNIYNFLKNMFRLDRSYGKCSITRLNEIIQGS